MFIRISHWYDILLLVQVARPCVLRLFPASTTVLTKPRTEPALFITENPKIVVYCEGVDSGGPALHVLEVSFFMIMLS